MRRRPDRLRRKSAGEKRRLWWKKWAKRGVRFGSGFSLDEVIRYWRNGLSGHDPPWRDRGTRALVEGS